VVYANMGGVIVDMTSLARCCNMLHDQYGRARPANTHACYLSSGGRGGGGGRRQHQQHHHQGQSQHHQGGSNKKKKGRRR
jgi:hypothetical protein